MTSDLPSELWAKIFEMIGIGGHSLNIRRVCKIYKCIYEDVWRVEQKNFTQYASPTISRILHTPSAYAIIPRPDMSLLIAPGVSLFTANNSGVVMLKNAREQSKSYNCKTRRAVILMKKEIPYIELESKVYVRFTGTEKGKLVCCNNPLDNVEVRLNQLKEPTRFRVLIDPFLRQAMIKIEGQRWTAIGTRGVLTISEKEHYVFINSRMQCSIINTKNGDIRTAYNCFISGNFFINTQDRKKFAIGEVTIEDENLKLNAPFRTFETTPWCDVCFFGMTRYGVTIGYDKLFVKNIEFMRLPNDSKKRKRE